MKLTNNMSKGAVSIAGAALAICMLTGCGTPKPVYQQIGTNKQFLAEMRALPQPYLCVNTLRYDGGGLSVAAIGRPLEEELP